MLAPSPGPLKSMPKPYLKKCYVMMKKTLEKLPKPEPNGADPSPPEAEPPHQMLARLTTEKQRLLVEIREHRSAWPSATCSRSAGANA
jgi:hypothetical protein